MKQAIRLAAPEEIDRWDELVLANPDGGHIMQSKSWAAYKESAGFEVRNMVAEGDQQIAMLCYGRKVPVLGKYWYCPKGPGVADAAGAEALAQGLSSMGLDGFMVRIEPELPYNIRLKGLIHAGSVQPKATIIVNLTLDEENILASLKQKTRYNIRLSQRKGVRIEAVECSAENMEIMYGLMRATQQRGGYFLHRKEHYLSYWRLQAEAGQGQLLFAEHQGQVLAGVFVQLFGTKSWYKDGGSIREKSSLMAPYLLQWEAMRWAKAHGAMSYDMVGVPPKDKLGSGHMMDSLYQFKAGFNPEITEFTGAWDVVLNEQSYRLWRKAFARIYTAYNSRIKHEFIF